MPKSNIAMGIISIIGIVCFACLAAKFILDYLGFKKEREVDNANTPPPNYRSLFPALENNNELEFRKSDYLKNTEPKEQLTTKNWTCSGLRKL